MKRFFVRLTIVVVLLAGVSVPAALIETYTFTDFSGDPSLSIPDGNAAGVSDSRTISSAISEIGALTVRLDVAAEFNGDLYVYVRHGSGFSVLLNRAGRTGSNGNGYDDSGFTVSFTDGAANGDIHNYQNVTTPAPGSPLTGIWQPDGRDVDPAVVLDTDSRTALLANFNSMNASGEWTLFAADLQGGAVASIGSWELEITAVPEPEYYSLASALGLLVAAALRNALQRRKQLCA